MKEIVLETEIEKNKTTYKIQRLEDENKALRSQLERQDLLLKKGADESIRLSRVEKGLNLLQRWAEERGDEFLIDLLDLLD